MNRRAFLETMCLGGLATFGRPRVTFAQAQHRASGLCSASRRLGRPCRCRVSRRPGLSVASRIAGLRRRRPLAPRRPARSVARPRAAARGVGSQRARGPHQRGDAAVCGAELGGRPSPDVERAGKRTVHGRGLVLNDGRCDDGVRPDGAAQRYARHGSRNRRGWLSARTEGGEVDGLFRLAGVGDKRPLRRARPPPHARHRAVLKAAIAGTLDLTAAQADRVFPGSGAVRGAHQLMA